jgi:hypothetical protein
MKRNGKHSFEAIHDDDLEYLAAVIEDEIKRLVDFSNDPVYQLHIKGHLKYLGKLKAVLEKEVK